MTPPRLSRLSLAPQHRVFGAFFLYAFGIGGLFPRLADIQRAMGVPEGAFGLALAGTATGTLLSLSIAGRLLERIGHRRAFRFLTPMIALFFAAASWARTPLTMFLLLLPAGLAIGVVEVATSLEADRLEHARGRRLMNRAHGFWSLGFFAAGGVGALLSQVGVSAQVHLALMVPAVTLAAWLLTFDFRPAPERPHVDTARIPRFARPTRYILLLVSVTLAAMVLEGAAADWSAIYMRKAFDAPPFLAGAAVAAGALMQALVRFFVDPCVERYGPVTVARWLLTVLGAGTTLVLLAPKAALALLGFGLMGVGTSAIFPLGMSAAAQRPDRPAAINVAALAQTSIVAFLAGPPLLGLVAEQLGVRWAFGICLPLVALSLATTGALKTPPAAPLPASQTGRPQREV